MENKDFLGLDVPYLTNAYIRQKDKEDMKIVCANLLRFAWDKGLLLNNPFNEEGELILTTRIYENDVTELGRQIFSDLCYKWLTYTDNLAGKIDRKNNIKMLEKYHNQLIQQLEIKQ